MNDILEDWRAFSRATTARPHGAMPGAAGFIDLSGHRGLLQVSGADTLALLQGQFTADIRAIGPRESRLAGLCNPKGRLLALTRITQSDAGYQLLLPAELSAAITQRLSMFVLRSDARIDDRSTTTVCIGLDGEATVDWLSQHVGSVPETVGGSSTTDGLLLLRVPALRPRFLLYGPAGSLRPLWTELGAAFPLIDADQWELSEIDAGIPEIYAATVAAFVPQMINLQALGGISFRKGCYTGQEIVARMQYLGTLKRRMYLAGVAAATEAPVPGIPLFGDDPSDPQAVGQVVRAARRADGGYQVLAVLKIAAAERGDIHLGTAGGPELVFQPLPYPLDLAP